jgi:hypothetical protein
MPKTSRAETYLVKAAECFLAAEKATDPARRELHLELAAQWQLLAQAAEEFDGDGGSSDNER